MSNANTGYRLANSNPDDDDYEHTVRLQEAADLHIASVAEKKRLWWRNAAINLFFISGWFIFAILLSVYNKWMFSPDHFGFPYPLFVTSLHMFVQTALAAGVRAVWPQFRAKERPSRRDYARKVAPAGITTGLDIGLSNLSMKTITLSFYTMIKSSTLFFVLLFAFLFHLETPSWRLTGVILLIVTGVILMVATETDFALLGFILCLSASALSGLRWSLTQLLVRTKRSGMEDPIGAIFYLAPLGGLVLALVSMVFEQSFDVFWKEEWFGGIGLTLKTLALLLFPGALAFCMILSEMYIIKRAGVVPMSISGIAKEVATISVSAWLFGDTLTPLNITGVAITACGIFLYTYHKYRKSLDSTVPLDAHGNPVDIDVTVVAEETVRLNGSATHVRRRSTQDEVLFAVADGDEDADDNFSVHTPRRNSNGHSHLSPGNDHDIDHDLDSDSNEEADDTDDQRSLRSIRSTASKPGRGRAAEAARAVARESMDVERTWQQWVGGIRGEVDKRLGR